MALTFDCVFYYVSDLQRAVEFYRDVLGFRLQSSDVVARFLVDGVLLELVPTSYGERLEGQGNARLCLGVEDILYACAELRSKGVQCSPVRNEGTGMIATIQDLDGNELCFWQDARPEQGKRNVIWV